MSPQLELPGTLPSCCWSGESRAQGGLGQPPHPRPYPLGAQAQPCLSGSSASCPHLWLRPRQAALGCTSTKALQGRLVPSLG